MQTPHQRFFSLLFSVVVVLSFASHVQSQTDPSAAIWTHGPRPAWEGTAAGDAKPFIRNYDDLKTALLSQPVPEVWFEFAESKRKGQPPQKSSDGKEPVIQVVLPAEAKELLKTFWEESLKFDYGDFIEKPQTGQERYDRDQAWVIYSVTMMQKLQKIEIAFPDITRKISIHEALDLVHFLRKASGNLITSAKQR